MATEKLSYPLPPYSTYFASLSLHTSDSIRMLRFPANTIDAVRYTITKCWSRGLQADRPYESSHEFKMRGNPWTGSGSQATSARHLMKGILATLFAHGWMLVTSTDIAKREYDKDVLLFRLQTPPPAPHEWIGVSFSRGDRLRLYDAPSDLCEDANRTLSAYAQGQGSTNENGAFELKLNGYPWRSSSGSQGDLARNLILDLLQVLEKHGFTLYASIDQKQSNLDADSWYCCRAMGWTPGQPVFHG